MDENVFAILPLYKSEAFCGVKPLHGTCFFHVSSTSSYDGFFKSWESSRLRAFPAPSPCCPSTGAQPGAIRATSLYKGPSPDTSGWGLPPPLFSEVDLRCLGLPA